MAEREGREILEEDCDEEVIQSPFQPISSVISVVCVIVAFRVKTHLPLSSQKNGSCSVFHFQYENKEKMNVTATASQLSHKER